MQLIKKEYGKGLFILICCCLVCLASCFTVYATEGEVAKVAITDGSSGSDSALPDLFTGTMSFSVPIEVPPGRKGMDPGIALTYRSNNGNGLLGVGWELEVGSIQRSLKHGVHYDKDDYQYRKTGATSDLVKIGNSDSNNFQTKIEGGFTKLTKKISTVDNRPYWEATDKFGVKFTFGESSESRQDDPNNSDRIFRWCLNKVEDTNGNYMTISYDKTQGQAYQGQIYLKQINYTGNEAKDPTNHVIFYYEQRSDALDMYSTHFKVTTSYRLRAIDVIANSNRLRKYELVYNADPLPADSHSTGRSLLGSINQYGSDGTSLLASNSIEWQKGSSGLTDKKEWITNTYGGWYTYPGSIRVMANSNGIQSIIIGPDNEGLLYELLTTGSAFVRHDQHSPLTSLAAWSGAPDLIRGMDVNGDGFQEIVAGPDGNGSWYLIHRSSANGEYFVIGTLTGPFGLYGNWAGASDRIRVIDVDGDGKQDIVLGPDGSGKWYVMRSTGNSFEKKTAWDSTSAYGAWDGASSRIRTMDVNGDGLQDIVLGPDGSGNWYVMQSTGSGFEDKGAWITDAYGAWHAAADRIRAMDVNGDGLQDIVLGPDGSGNWYVLLSTGSSFLNLGASTSNYGGWDGYSNLIRTMDVNGDGLQDIVLGPESNGNWHVMQSTGSGFVDKGASESQYGAWAGSSSLIRTMDVNSDGMQDIVLGPEWNGNWYVMQANGPFPDLVTTITNSFGGVTSVSYTPSTRYSNKLLPFPVRTVSEISTNDGKGHVATTYYKYAGGFFHIGERDFRGFNEVSVWGPVSDGKQNRTTTYFHQGSDTGVVHPDNPFSSVGYTKGKPYRTKTWEAAGVVYGNEIVNPESLKLISETTTSYEPDSDNIAPYFTPPKQIDNYLYGVVSKHTKTVYTFDDYGNMTREENYGDVNDPPPADRTIEKKYFYNTTDYIVGLPYRETVYEGIGTATPKASHDYYYDDLASCSAQATGNQTPVKGNLTRVQRWLDGGVNPEQWTAYDSYGNVLCTRDPNSVRDPNGKIATITYDSSNTFPTTVTNPLGQQTVISYYGVDGVLADNGLYGQEKSVTDPNGATTTMVYDKFGRKWYQNLPDSFWTVWTYNDSGLVGTQNVRTSNAAGLWSESYFDGLGRIIKERKSGPDSKIIVTEKRYNPRGGVAEVASPYFEGAPDEINWTRFTYDPVGRIIEITNPDEKRLLTCYSPGATVTIDANNHRKRQTMDAFGRLVKVEEYLGTFSDCTAEPSPYATTTYKYDVLGNLVLVTDAKGNKSEMFYDTLGRKYRMKDPDMGEWNYDYDANGNLTLQTDAKQQKINFKYDELNRLWKKDFNADDDIDVTFTYDESPFWTNGIGRLTTMTDGTGSTTYRYDKMGRIISKVNTEDGKSFMVSFGYDKGRLASVTYPQEGSYIFNGENGEEEVPIYETVNYGYNLSGDLTTVGSYATFADFTALGQPKRITYGNGVVTTYDYKPTNNRLNSIITTSPTQGELISISYDYYNNGNVWKITDNLNTVIPHNFVSERFTPHTVKPHAIGFTDSGRSFHYDENGNMDSDGKRSVSYNLENMPTSVTSSSSIVNFTYDGNGQRVKKTSGDESRVYIGNLYECISNGLCGKSIYAGDTLIAVKDSQSIRYYHGDHLGSTKAVTDGAGNKIESIEYYPFGENRSDTGSVNVNNKYTSQELDYEVGLYNYNARLYDPEIGRFISADSIVPDPANPQSLNRYSYVINNPLIYTDPTGHKNFFKELIDDIGDFFQQIGRDGISMECGNGTGRCNAQTANAHPSAQTGGSGIPPSGGGGSGGGGGVPGNATWYYGGGDTAYGTMPLYANSAVTNYTPSSAFGTNVSFGFPGGSGGGGGASTQPIKNGNVSFSINGTLGGQVVPTFPGLYVGGGVNVGLTTNGQLYLQAQANGMTGVGYYAGIGTAVGGGISRGNLPTGFSIDSAVHIEGNAGWGPLSTGYSSDINKESLSVSRAKFFGEGVGIMQGAGMSRMVTVATPALW